MIFLGVEDVEAQNCWMKILLETLKSLAENTDTLLGGKYPMSRLRETQERRLEKACKHVTSLWFPVSVDLLDKVREGFRRNELTQPRAVFEQVRGDFSLFMYSMRELSRLLREQSKEVPSDPIQLFELSGIETLRQVLNVDARELSSHSLDKLTPYQIERFQECFISASSCEVLASSTGIGKEECYTGALLRQLGLTLISFNYETVYEEILASLKPDESLDDRLAEALGFPPTLLAVTLLRQWGIADEFQKTVEFHYMSVDEPAEERKQTTVGTLDPRRDAIAQTLSKLCDVGEALARANNPDRYPTAAHDWDMAREFIEKELGKKGLSIIRKKLKENLKGYFAAAPAAFKGGIILDPEMAIAHQWDDDHLRRNPFLAHARDPLRRKLHDLYARLTGVQATKECLGYLVKEILPIAGFEAVCIYTVDPTTKVLIPQLRMGTTKLRTLSPVALTDKTDPVATAFETSVPIIEHSKKNGKDITYLVWILGFSNRAGVLYAEMDYEQFAAPEVDYLAHFKALSKAFSDCLNLG